MVWSLQKDVWNQVVHFLHNGNARFSYIKGTTVTWLWEEKDHNVNPITKQEFETCTVSNNTKEAGNYVWTAPETAGTHYFACGRFNGGHCRNGNMRATVKVSNHCPWVSKILIQINWRNWFNIVFLFTPICPEKDSLLSFDKKVECKSPKVLLRLKWRGPSLYINSKFWNIDNGYITLLLE